MKKSYFILLVFVLCSLPVLSDTVRTNTCLHNLYETKSEVVSEPTVVTVTKPKRKLFRKQKTNELSAPDIVIPAEHDGFIVFRYQMIKINIVGGDIFLALV